MPPRPAPSTRPAPAAAPLPRAMPRAAAASVRRRAGDWMWHGVGGAAAAASAGFAAYALVFSTGQVVPSGNFNVFNGYDRLYRAAAAQHAPTADARGPQTADRGGVDFEPTGAVPPAAAGAAPGGRPRSDGPALPGFTLRDVFDGKALIESRSALAVVKPGSVLEGAGEILSIENRGGHWVVVTRNGVIAGQSR